MTQEEKAKAYDEALERAKKFNIDDAYAYQGAVVKSIFPELKENDDKKILKAIQRYLDWLTGYPNFAPKGKYSIRDMLHYLFKLEDKTPSTTEQVYEKFLSSDTLKSARENKYIRAQLLWELMHNGIITEVDYQYLTDVNRKPWTEEEYRKAYKKGFEASEQLKHLGM